MSSLISLYEQLMIYQLLMLQDEYVKEHLLLSYLSGIAWLLFPLGQHKNSFTDQPKDKTKKATQQYWITPFNIYNYTGGTIGGGNGGGG